MQILGVRRAHRFSPNSVARDAEIFNAVVRFLSSLGHSVVAVDEDALRYNKIYDRVFSMARSEEALAQLLDFERHDCPVINSPQALLRTSRVFLYESFLAAGIPQPQSWVLEYPCSLPPDLDYPLWLKRGEGCAQAKGDVQYICNEATLKTALQTFQSEAPKRLLLSRHMQGDLIKFYGVAGTSFFHSLYPTQQGGFSKFGLEQNNGKPHYYPFSLPQLQTAAERAATISGLSVYGGDAIVQADGSFYIIDFNDWPSFSPCVNAAAEAISQLILSGYDS